MIVARFIRQLLARFRLNRLNWVATISEAIDDPDLC
jgi:hypothetical protein